MHTKKTCGARNRQGQPCSRIPAPGASRCYKHDDGLDSLTDEELAALLEWHEELILLGHVETPTRDQIDRCKALWIMTHAYEVLARQRAGLRSNCPVPCGLCGALDDVFNYREPVAAGTVVHKPTVLDDEPEDANDSSVEVL